MLERTSKGLPILADSRNVFSRSGALFMCAFVLTYLSGCSSGPVSASSCSIREGPAHSTILVATLTNGSEKAIRHVGVLVGATEYEYDFGTPLAAGQSIRDTVGSEYKEPEDDIRIACETKEAPRNCAELQRNGYKVPWPADVPTLSPLPVSDKPQMGSTPVCWARSIVYADGSVWSVSAL
jgi:hypothetical protein